MIRAALRRLAMVILLGAGLFLLVAALPGERLRAQLGPDASAEELARAAHERGLDRPLLEQLVRWVADVAAGDWGRTLQGTPIRPMILGVLPSTLLLAGVTLILGTAIAWALACLAHQRPRSLPARALGPLTALTIAIPEFVHATVLVAIFGVTLGWLPTGWTGSSDPLVHVLPVAVLSLHAALWNATVARAALDHAAQAPHVQAARLNGETPFHVLVSHVLPAAMPTMVASVVSTLGVLVSGAVVVETVFNLPGLGAVLTSAIAARDAPVVSTVAVVAAVPLAVLLTGSDVLAARAGRAAGVQA